MQTSPAQQHLAQQYLAQQRLAQQHLAGPLVTPASVVAWMGAVQAQEYLGGAWALGLRLQAATQSAIDAAFDSGEILRTHVLRPTWHFVMPEDIRWLLDLTGPRVKSLNGTYYRQTGLDAATLSRSNDVIAKQLEGGRYQTRAELGEALQQAGIDIAGLRAPLLVMHAELDGIICSGPRRGKQFTYALIAERAPHARTLPRDEALAALVLRYFTSHGPATLQDFAWWSGLTLADAKQGVALAGVQLEAEVIAGDTYWRAPDMLPAAPAAAQVYLLPTFDEFLVGYSGFDAARQGSKLRFPSVLLVNGSVAGSWRRTQKRKVVTVEVAPFVPLTAGQVAQVEAAAAHYGDFVGLPAEVILRD